jgi:hypothetical protein
MSEVLQHWQDGFNSAILAQGQDLEDGETFRAEKENFPKLWITNEQEAILFSPVAGKVYTNTKEGVQTLLLSEALPTGPNGEELNSRTLFKPVTPSLQGATAKQNQTPLSVYWKETEPEEKIQSCLVYVYSEGIGNGNTITSKFWDFEAMKELKTPETKIFSFGSPLKEAKLTGARYGAYTSTDWGRPPVTFGFFGPLINLAAGALGSLFGDAGVELPPEYGSAEHYPGTLQLENGNSMMNSVSLPVCLQARGELFPLLERIKLINSKSPELDVYQFRTSRSDSLFFRVDEIPLVNQTDLLEDKPIAWYLMEDPQNGATDTNPCYVIGIGQNYARVHMPDDSTAFQLEILNDSDLFEPEKLSMPLKQRTARKQNEKNGGSTNMTADKLKRVTEEIASKVSYKTICALMSPVSPDGKDTTVEFYHEVNGELQKVRLVLYAVHKKHVKYLGEVGGDEEAGPESPKEEDSDLFTLSLFQGGRAVVDHKEVASPKKNITHFVGVWNNSELVDGYWASADDTLVDSLTVVDEVKMVMQMGGVITSNSLIRAELDVESPNFYFNDIQGEYGAAFRLSALQEFERHRGKCSGDPVFGSIFSDIAQVVQGAARTGLLGDTAKTIGDTNVLTTIAGIFGLSETEPSGMEVDIAFEGSVLDQPFTKIVGVYDQGKSDICVLCSIGHAISMIKSLENEFPLQKINQCLTTVIPVSSVPRGGLNITYALTMLQSKISNTYGLTWKRITPNVTSIKNVLANGLPVIAGIKFDQQLLVYNSNLDQPISGPTFGPGRVPLLHCVTIVAYDDADSTFTVLNSYSSSWGRNGAMIIEQDYGGIDRAFILEEEVAKFGIIDLKPGLDTVPFE